jgi:hypothetical protein
MDMRSIASGTLIAVFCLLAGTLFTAAPANAWEYADGYSRPSYSNCCYRKVVTYRRVRPYGYYDGYRPSYSYNRPYYSRPYYSPPYHHSRYDHGYRTRSY